MAGKGMTDSGRRSRGRHALRFTEMAGAALAVALLPALLAVSPASASGAGNRVAAATAGSTAATALTTSGAGTAGAGTASAPGVAGPAHVVSYHGYAIRAPASWPVYRLAGDPSRCVLFNRHAVYLGTPGADERCPARALGRTEAILVQPEPAAAQLPPATLVLPRGSTALPVSAALPASIAAQDATGHSFQIAVPGPGVLVTATYGTDPAQMRQILASATRAGGTRASATRASAAQVGATRPGATQAGATQAGATRPGATRAGATRPGGTQAGGTQAGAAQAGGAPGRAYHGRPGGHPARPLAGQGRRARPATASTLQGEPGTGLGFDTCTAPSRATMSAWLASPYRVAGTYLGGANWACTYGNFTASWVTQVAAQGWQFIPIWVGLQAPCTQATGVTMINPAKAAAEGKAEAASAVAAAQQFGYGSGTPVYYDMEGYDSADTSCKQTVLTFLGAWTKALHAAGYLSGVYSTAASGIHDLAGRYNSPAYARPDDIWIADWTGDPVLTDSFVPAADWPGHRLHQYYGAHNETWGGAAVNVDNNEIGGTVAGLPGGGNTPRPAVFGQPDAVSAAPGRSGTVTLTIDGATSGTATVTWQASPPTGITVSPASGSSTVAAGASHTVKLTVKLSASLAAGRYDVPITASTAQGPITETFELISAVAAKGTLPTAYPIVLYAADHADMATAAAEANRLALPSGDVTGTFVTAWNDLTGGSDLVLAVGKAADNALFFNPCGWTNPAGTGAGSTPFSFLGVPWQSPAGADNYEPSDGASTTATTALTAQLSHYALAGTLPNEGVTPDPVSPPTQTCLGSPSVPVP
jgi:hypothetical protein